MILTIANILDDETLASVTKTLASLTWQDGRVTAGRTAAQVKNNQQAILSPPKGEALRNELKEAILKNPVFAAAARPKRLSSLLISKATEGGHYGPHIDNALMGSGGTTLRTDLSFTLALTPPDSYEGGELTIHLPGTVERVKPLAGDLVLYPSTAIHEVSPVVQGARIVCVGWVQSLIDDPQIREILFDLENLRASLRTHLPRSSAELLTLDKAIANLLRVHARP
ncbi:putative hydroxylase [Parvularcula bermudensis HTCC2503]|uniref:Putative hydroxylase n=1 Tax=Parvularcula bermudensis (strain ATCC BAA-594 / HTCC2503 / KCTC 12087) TaxID=314260 RepID=E0THF1_PARBH|nr:Fe2+-dependent dioxygenase [Parvularcula bermudensis]ADM10743.1 putative hydroxylase [Parvularcula bermudensis HTCC2503]